MHYYKKILFKSISAGSLYSFFIPIKAAEINSKTKNIKPIELPLYEEPPKVKYILEPEKISFLRVQISVVRKSIWSYLDSIQDSLDSAKNKYTTARDHTQESLLYIRDDASLPARIAIITVAGLGGIVAGFRGGKIKKSIYASIGMLTAASICYPEEAIKTYNGACCMARQQLGDYFPFKGLKKEMTVQEKVEKIFPKNASKFENTKDTKVDTAPEIIDTLNKIKKDHGMSSSQDKDMYTSRG